MSLVVNGEVQGGGGSVAAADITDAGATGVELLQAATEADALGALSGRVVDPLTGSGWTTATVGGAATATWETGPARLLLANPAAALGNEAHATHSTFLPEGDSFDLYARFDVLAGTSADLWFSLRAGADASNVLAFDIHANGAIDVYRTSGGSSANVGSASAGGSLAPSTSQLASGDFWAKISRRPTGVALSWAVSSGVPTSWLTVLNLTDVTSLNVTRGRYVRLNTYAAASVGGGFNVNVLDIRAAGRGLGPL